LQGAARELYEETGIDVRFKPGRSNPTCAQVSNIPQASHQPPKNPEMQQGDQQEEEQYARWVREGEVEGKEEGLDRLKPIRLKLQSGEIVYEYKSRRYFYLELRDSDSHKPMTVQVQFQPSRDVIFYVLSCVSTLIQIFVFFFFFSNIRMVPGERWVWWKPYNGYEQLECR
jgi:8-oxo-dGTP pyrophosphatase MutT (NUDIX family)